LDARPDAVGSRQEAGCLRFDVLRCPKQVNKFFFYEIYVDAAAIEVHKAQPHFKAWTDFKVQHGLRILPAYRPPSCTAQLSLTNPARV
jgi:hypothetical protein